MSIHTLAADIAARVPDMAKDCATNNAAVIEGLIRTEFIRGIKPTVVVVDELANMTASEWAELLKKAQ